MPLPTRFSIVTCGVFFQPCSPSKARAQETRCHFNKSNFTEVRGPVGQIVQSEKGIVAVERNKVAAASFYKETGFIDWCLGSRSAVLFSISRLGISRSQRQRRKS